MSNHLLLFWKSALPLCFLGAVACQPSKNSKPKDRPSQETPYSNPWNTGEPSQPSVPMNKAETTGDSGRKSQGLDRTHWDSACDKSTGRDGGTSNGICRCGLSGTIEERIADCASHAVIGAQASIDIKSYGYGAQGLWNLVTRTGAVSEGKGREVWRDENTGLLWSSRVSTSLNWCKASGANTLRKNPKFSEKYSFACGEPMFQVTPTVADGKSQAISACKEDVDDNGAEDFFTSKDPNIDSAGKGNLGLSSSSKVRWALPTEKDYEEASNNGIFFVLPDAVAQEEMWEWSASESPAGNKASAWSILEVPSANHREEGYWGSQYAVRCVSR